MKCPTCGRENRTTAGFCAWCGAHLAQPKPSAATPPAESAPTETLIVDANPTSLAPVAESTPIASLIRPENETEEVPSAVEPTPEAQEKLAGSHQPGDVVDDRYRIVELVESSSESYRYRAIDLRRCAACGNESGAQEDEYCEKCGASLEIPCYVNIVELVRHQPAQYDAHLAIGDRDYFITLEPPSPAPQVASVTAPTEKIPLRLRWGRATDKGVQRDQNEDYFDAWLYLSDKGGALALFVVADGLGGQDSGEVASRMATEAVWKSLRESVWQPTFLGEPIEPAQLEQSVGTAVRAANQAVYEARIARHSEMSSTLTLALIVDNVAYIANVGDSRTYLWNANGLRRITKDHSLVQRLVDTGMIQPQEVYSHPQRNLIYQSIGDRPDVTVDIFQHPLAGDDRLILCSDGLWEMVHDEGLEEVLLAEPDPQAASDRLVHDANVAGGEDNITVVIVHAVL